MIEPSGRDRILPAAKPRDIQKLDRRMLELDDPAEISLSITALTQIPMDAGQLEQYMRIVLLSPVRL